MLLYPHNEIMTAVKKYQSGYADTYWYEKLSLVWFQLKKKNHQLTDNNIFLKFMLMLYINMYPLCIFKSLQGYALKY